MAMAELPDELFTAVGRVSACSAYLEDVLRFVVSSHTTGFVSHGAVILEGQSMDWLIGNGVAVLDSRLRGWHIVGEPPEPLDEVRQLRSLLKAAEPVKNARNLIVHGTWNPRCCWEPFPEKAAIWCKPRSTTPNRSSQVFHVSRSRYRQLASLEEAWTIAEVLAVATEIEDLAERLSDAQEAYEIAIEAE
ncbi:hypothetical protein [Nocardia sp. NPDC056100]|uniref:hypothetical protein n=1 Tax=Nocardia sp. NPDC056100 TaxID=3345712 RepID=UPI0035DE441D